MHVQKQKNLAGPAGKIAQTRLWAIMPICGARKCHWNLCSLSHFLPKMCNHTRVVVWGTLKRRLFCSPLFFHLYQLIKSIAIGQCTLKRNVHCTYYVLICSFYPSIIFINKWNSLPALQCTLAFINLKISALWFFYQSVSVPILWKGMQFVRLWSFYCSTSYIYMQLSSTYMYNI